MVIAQNYLYKVELPVGMMWLPVSKYSVHFVHRTNACQLCKYLCFSLTSSGRGVFVSAAGSGASTFCNRGTWTAAIKCDNERISAALRMWVPDMLRTLFQTTRKVMKQCLSEHLLLFKSSDSSLQE